MKRGFQFAETMSGTFALASAPQQRRRFSFSILAHAPSALAHLLDGKTALRGTLEADGLATSAPIEGTLTLAPLTRRMIRYEFSFTGDDGQRYRFAGQKDIRLRDLRRSFTVLPGRLTDEDGREVGTADTRFDLGADLFQFLSSWRPA
jgi:hypothetical protein